MKNIIRLIFISSIILILGSCGKDYLEISDPNNPTGDTYYTSLVNAQLAVNGVYGEFHDEHLYFGEIFYILCYSTGEADYFHPESRYSDFNNYNYGPTNSLIAGYYKGWYRIIGRANNVLNGINTMLASGGYNADEVTQLNYMKGQCYFLRGLAYSFLIRSFGEKMPGHPAYNENLPGTIIADSVILVKEQMYKDRSSCGEVYNYIINDFKAAESFLPESWSGSEVGKATKGSAQAFLGETYVYLKDWDKAKISFEKILANKDYQLVTDFSHNFDYEHINNSESLFEIGFNNGTIGYVGTYAYRLLALQSWGTTKIRIPTIDRFSSSVVINEQTLANALNAKNTVIGSVFKAYVDTLLNLATPLLGNSFESKLAFLDQIDNLTNIPFYKADGITFEKGVAQFLDAVSPKDPRLVHTVYSPKKDSIVVFDPTTKTWNRKLFDFSSYGWKKYIPDSVEVEGAKAAGMGNDGHMNMNFRIMRLDDVYLYYAEVMHNLNDDAAAREYINKIVRRANGFPIDSPSEVDLNPSDIMAELRNQTFREFCLEGKIWFHFRRWNRGLIEWGSLGYKENKNECLPIPQGEFDSNPGIKTQNIGY